MPHTREFLQNAGCVRNIYFQQSAIGIHSAGLLANSPTRVGQPLQPNTDRLSNHRITRAISYTTPPDVTALVSSAGASGPAYWQPSIRGSRRFGVEIYGLWVVLTVCGSGYPELARSRARSGSRSSNHCLIAPLGTATSAAGRSVSRFLGQRMARC